MKDCNEIINDFKKLQKYWEFEIKNELNQNVQQTDNKESSSQQTNNKESSTQQTNNSNNYDTTDNFMLVPYFVLPFVLGLLGLIIAFGAFPPKKNEKKGKTAIAIGMLLHIILYVSIFAAYCNN